jgi:hypothetical protein
MARREQGHTVSVVGDPDAWPTTAADVTPEGRENALLDILEGGTPMCPYLFRVPAEGAHGPQTCPGGCIDEPCTTSGPYPVFNFPDLVLKVQMVMVGQTLERCPNNHPAVAWWAEHVG